MWLINANKLSLNLAKTNFMMFKYANSQGTRFPDVILYENMNWYKHINMLTSNI